MRYFVLILFICALLVGGCKEPDRAAMADVAVIGIESFPAELVGTWQSDRQNWAIVLDENGNISQITHALGATVIESEGINVFEKPSENAFMRHEIGELFASYDPINNELTVLIGLDWFELTIGDDFKLTGHSKDVFTGNPNLADGVLVVDWIRYTQYYRQIGETSPELFIDESEGVTERLIFTKVTD